MENTDSAYIISPKYANDEFQKEVITLDSGYHLVLAPPGCGKTDILAERVARALSRGVQLDEMLCLTFTNRAARGMRTRIAQRLGIGVNNNLFVGNVHRFCSQLLFNGGILPLSTAILDENDMISVMQSLIGEAEAEVTDFDHRQFFTDISTLQHLMFQYRHAHANSLLLDTKIFQTYNLRRFFIQAGYEYTKENFLSVYDDIEQVSTRPDIPESVRDAINLFRYAKRYDLYKHDKNLIDFDDLLLLTYEYARRHADEIKKYKWIQIDEVQDLNVMQFAIIDCFTHHSDEAVTLYLGDEQQAIYSFIGAKLSTLETLKQRCHGNVHRLYNNYRSPKYLLDVFNTYANMQLDVSLDFLPKSSNHALPSPHDLCIMSALDKKDEVAMVVRTAKGYLDQYPDERVAVLVPWNKDADSLSDAFTKSGVKHFKISGTDIFSQPEIQLLFSHFYAINFETNYFAWSRIFHQIGIFAKQRKAREFVGRMSRSCVAPTDLFHTDGKTYMMWFAQMCKGEYVIFDTETTGLDVFTDDIVQIAAIKIRNGEVVEELNVMMYTDKPIPPMLGDIVNPLVEEYKMAEKYSRDEGLRKFLHFVGPLPILGHNVEFDYHILDYNLRRDCGISNLSDLCPVYFDSLKAIRLVEPKLKAYKLKYLLSVLHLEGSNSHLANDDIVATKSVVDYCCHKFGQLRQRHLDFLTQYKKEIDDIRQKYADYYYHTKHMLYERRREDETPALVGELQYLYAEFIRRRWIRKNDKVDHVFRYLQMDVILPAQTPSLFEQLNAHVVEMATYKEADLCDSQSVDERLFISTVHKAKGLEFDNVIVFEATDGVYPFFAKNTTYEVKESARLFYVAMSRARKRLCLAHCRQVSGMSRYGKYYCIEKESTPFLKHIAKYFTYLNE